MDLYPTRWSRVWFRSKVFLHDVSGSDLYVAGTVFGHDAVLLLVLLETAISHDPRFPRFGRGVPIHTGGSEPVWVLLSLRVRLCHDLALSGPRNGRFFSPRRKERRFGNGLSAESSILSIQSQPGMAQGLSSEKLAEPVSHYPAGSFSCPCASIDTSGSVASEG